MAPKSVANDPRLVKMVQQTIRKEVDEFQKAKESVIAENMKKLTNTLAKGTKKNVSRRFIYLFWILLFF